MPNSTHGSENNLEQQAPHLAAHSLTLKVYSIDLPSKQPSNQPSKHRSEQPGHLNAVHPRPFPVALDRAYCIFHWRSAVPVTSNQSGGPKTHTNYVDNHICKKPGAG
jgi:hypothetical protein